MTLSDLRARILGSKPKIVLMPVPEWGDVEIGVRALTLAERLTFEAVNGTLDMIDRKNEAGKYNAWLVRYVIASACDPSGEKLFRPDDEPDLLRQSAVAIERLCLAAMRVNALSASEVAKLGEASGEARNGASPSDSPVISN
jgi:hypothetical protein